MGTCWTDELAAGGEAQCVQTGGYPNIYTAPVGSVVPRLLGKMPSAKAVCPGVAGMWTALQAYREQMGGQLAKLVGQKLRASWTGFCESHATRHESP